MSAAAEEPCPKELLDISDEIPFCGDAEEVLYIVRFESWIEESVDNERHLLAIAISEDDLKKANRSVSTLRLRMTAPAEIVRRAIEINKEPKWNDDPLGCIAVVKDLRDIKDASQRREVCVFAEPTTAEKDRLGACLSHAGVKRSCNPPKNDSRLSWALLRKQVALCFDRMVYIRSTFGDVEDSA